MYTRHVCRMKTNHMSLVLLLWLSALSILLEAKLRKVCLHFKLYLNIFNYSYFLCFRFLLISNEKLNLKLLPWMCWRKSLASVEKAGIVWNWWKPSCSWKPQTGIGSTCSTKVGTDKLFVSPCPCPWLSVVLSAFLVLTFCFCTFRYLHKEKVNGPEGNTTFYELAERALDGPINDGMKEYISKV